MKCNIIVLKIKKQKKIIKVIDTFSAVSVEYRMSVGKIIV